MDNDKLQKLANLAVIRQHAAGVTASTTFNRKYINDVDKALRSLDAEFHSTLMEIVGDVGKQDANTISQRLAEEKAKLKAKLEPVPADLPKNEEAPVTKESRPVIKTSRTSKKNETPVKE